MCGISAIVSKDLSMIQEMTDLVAHRGPDASDVWFGEGFALGHRRLSILDLSDDGKQPMPHQVTGNTIVFNGEIYNYIEIREELKLLGHVFKTKTDTEVILSAYAEWGGECTKRFNGMWAIIIHDKKKDQLFISRDRFGVKPLYYFKSETVFALGSEIKQLFLFTPRKANINYLTNYLVTGLLEYSDETFFDKILKLTPSHNMIYELKTGKTNITRYYDLKQKELKKTTVEEATREFSGLFNSSIDLRLRSDVKVGTCLSGGLDSSAVATVASDKYQGGNFQGIFAKSSEKETDESFYAELVAKTKNIDLNTIMPSYEDFSAQIEKVIYTQEEPFVSPSIFMQYFVMAKAKEIGCKVMLDGQGGDETLLGYEKYYPSVLYEKLSKEGIPSFFNGVRSGRMNNEGLSLKNLAKYIFGMLFWRIRLMGHFFNASMLKKKHLYSNYGYLKTLSKCVTTSPFSLQRFEIFHTNLPSLLRYEDKNSMKHSIEARLPFLDYRLVEFNLNLPSDFKINQGWSKYILRKFLDPKLPREIIWRKKKLGFNAPETWLKSHELIMKNEIKNSKLLAHICNRKLAKVGKRNGSIFWRLYNIAVWERVYSVQVDH